MTCTNTIQQLDDFLDDALSPQEALVVRRHLQTCPACAAELSQLEVMRRVLARLPARAAESETLERLLAQAVRTAMPPVSRFNRQVAWRAGGLATAAALLLGFGIALGVKIAGREARDAGSRVMLVAQPIALGPTAERVGLMFRTADALPDASISVWLPVDIQIAGRPHVRHLSWHADLKPGPNLLELPLLASGSRGGTLVVRLTQGTLVRTLQIPIAVRSPKGPATGLQPASPTRVVPESV